MPLIVFSLLTGIVTDRFDRRRVLAVSGAAFSIGALALSWAATLDAVWPVYLIVVFISSGKAFLSPVSKALLPNLVPQGGLTRGVALTNSFGETARLLAPAIDGFRPSQVLAVGDPGSTEIPLLGGRFQLGGRPTAFVCRDFACRQPVTEPEALAALLTEA